MSGTKRPHSSVSEGTLVNDLCETGTNFLDNCGHNDIEDSLEEISSSDEVEWSDEVVNDTDEDPNYDPNPNPRFSFSSSRQRLNFDSNRPGASNDGGFFH